MRWELNAFARLIPDIDFFIASYVAREATLSSRIEGTQTTLEDAFKEADDLLPEARDDWGEVQNYITAIHYGIDRLNTLPLCNWLLKETHEMLMQGVRGTQKQPGQFRTSQNWIGVSLKNAAFIPPHHKHLEALMGDLEKFLHDRGNPLPPLIRIAMAHYQFETIHPFLDGNGRLGRLMISLYLASEGLLARPTLYLSAYFERNKTAYVDHLMAVREGDHMADWLVFFLHGVVEIARESIGVFQEILALKERIDSDILTRFGTRRQQKAQALVRHLYKRPVLDVNDVVTLLETTPATAGALVADLVAYGVLTERSGRRRNRFFVFDSYKIIQGTKVRMTQQTTLPSVSVRYRQSGSAKKINELGMRAMQERAFEKRGEQYLLIKSPPASGKSRALMFIALDKLHNQGVRQVIVAVPEKTIGASFHDAPLTQFGFYWDWQVKSKWNLCDAPGNDNGGKVGAVGVFLESDDGILVCTHATFRFAVDKFGVTAFDNRLIVVDEFHHVSANPDNKLGTHLGEFIARDKAHIVAMTGSYFRGDAEAVLVPQDEARFETVTYTYYEQLNGYEYLKTLDIGYYFYTGSYTNSILQVLNPGEKTIVYIPHINSRESTKDKHKEVEHIIHELGTWQGVDEDTGFHLVTTADGKTLRIADLVDDTPANRDKVSAALKRPEEKDNREHVDIIIALGMAKEGFDWIWCEHALTVGYRASLTEIVQIIGRTTRDAPGKTHARFTNLIAEPDASEEAVTDAVNDTLKAIAASLLMEQVLAPRFDFKPKRAGAGPTAGFDYGEGGYDPNGVNVGVNEAQGVCEIEIKGLVEPKSPIAKRICREDLNEVITSFAQDKTALERGLFDSAEAGGETVPQELTQIRMGKIVKDKYPELDDADQEAVRQHAIAALNFTQQAKEIATKESNRKTGGNTTFITGVRKFVMDVRELDIDLIDQINPFGKAYAILAKSMSETRLKQIAAIITAKRVSLTEEEARQLARRALTFKQERNRLPALTASDPWEKRMAEGVAFLARMKTEAARD